MESGNTMRAAGLEKVDVLMKTEAVFIGNPHSEHKDLIEIIRNRLVGALTAERFVMLEYNLPRNMLVCTAGLPLTIYRFTVGDCCFNHTWNPFTNNISSARSCLGCR